MSCIKVKISGSPSAFRSLNRGIEISESEYYDGINKEGNELRSKFWYGKSPCDDGLQIYNGLISLVNVFR